MSDFSKPEIPALGIMSTLADEDRRLLGDDGEFLPLQGDQDVIREGESRDGPCFEMSGLLHGHPLDDGKRTLLVRIEPGEAFGEVHVFDPGVARANVTAKQSTSGRLSAAELDAAVQSMRA